jgi:hypothetical protein
MKKRCCIGLIFIATTALASPPSQWSSPTNGYTLTISDGWKQVPPSSFPPLASGIPKTTTEVGFERDTTKPGLVAPYLRIILIPKETAGLTGLPSEKKFNDIMSLMTNGRTYEVDKGIDAMMSKTNMSSNDKAKTAYFTEAATSASVHVDTPNRRFWYTLDGTGLNDEGLVKSFNADIFLDNGNVVYLAGIIKASDFNKDMPKILEFYRSVQSAH